MNNPQIEAATVIDLLTVQVANLVKENAILRAENEWYKNNQAQEEEK